MPGYGGILSGLVQGYGQAVIGNEKRQYEEKQKKQQQELQMYQLILESPDADPATKQAAFGKIEETIHGGGNGKKSQGPGLLSRIGGLLSGHMGGDQPRPMDEKPPAGGLPPNQPAGPQGGSPQAPPQQQQGLIPPPQRNPQAQPAGQQGLTPPPTGFTPHFYTPEEKQAQATASQRASLGVQDEFSQKREGREQAQKIEYAETLAKFNSQMDVDQFGAKVKQAEEVLGRPLNKDEREQAVLSSLGVKQSMSIKFGPSVPGADIPEGTPDVYGQPVDKTKQYRQVIDGGKITGYQPIQPSSSAVVIRPGADPQTGKPALLIFDKSTGKPIGKAADIPVGYEVKEGPDGNFVTIPKQFQRPTGAGATPPPLGTNGTGTPKPAAGGLTPPLAPRNSPGGSTPPAAGATTPKTAGGLSQEALDLAAQKYLQTGQMTTLGYGKSAATQRAAILNRAAELERQRGGDSADLPTQQAAFHASATALGQLEKQKNMAMAFEGTTVRNLDIVQNMSNKVDRTGSPILNKYALYLKGQVAGDADTQLLKNSVISAANEYAKVISGSTGSAAATDASRREAEELLNASFSKGTTTKVIAQMKQEMENRRKGFDDQLGQLRQQMKGNPARPKPAKPGETITADKARSYLDMAGGNADEARKLAAQDGWTIK